MEDADYVELKCYIKYNLYYGQKREDIRRALLNADWPSEMISGAFSEVERLHAFIPRPKKTERVGKFTKVEEVPKVPEVPKPVPPKVPAVPKPKEEPKVPELPPPPPLPAVKEKKEQEKR